MDLDWERIETWAKGWVETLELDWFTPFRLSWTLSKTPAVFLWRAAYTSTSTLFHVARVPALILLRIILVFFSPIIFIVQYSLVPFWFALDILISLEVGRPPFHDTDVTMLMLNFRVFSHSTSL